jgi:hypothetical protein
MGLGPLGERLVHADTATRKPVDPLFYPTYIFVRPPTVSLHRFMHRGTDEWYLVRSRPAGRFRIVLTGHCTQWRTPSHRLRRRVSCSMFRWMNRSYSRRFHRRAIPRKTERHCYVSNVQSIYTLIMTFSGHVRMRQDWRAMLWNSVVQSIYPLIMHDSLWARADGVIARAGLPNFIRSLSTQCIFCASLFFTLFLMVRWLSSQTILNPLLPWFFLHPAKSQP